MYCRLVLRAGQASVTQREKVPWPGSAITCNQFSIGQEGGKYTEHTLYFHFDVVMCLKGSDENDEHNHLVISDLVSILRFEKSG